MISSTKKCPDLPSPDPNSLARSDAITLYIKSKEQITFHDYMSLALTHPDWGYYTNAPVIFGEQGDFVTAPQISALFSETVASALIPQLKENPDWVLIELGGGDASMTVGILKACEQANCLPKNYYLIEISPQLKLTQQTVLREKFPSYFPQIQWKTTCEPLSLSGIVIANEFFDAFPVHRFLINPHFSAELYVSVDENDKPYFRLDDPSTPELAEWLHRFRDTYASFNISTDYLSEVNLSYPTFFQTLKGMLAEGVVYIFDYGFEKHHFYHPERNQGTIMCYYHHHAHPDALLRPGNQDITAYIDFTALSEAAEKAEFVSERFRTQSTFLIEHGLPEAYHRLSAKLTIAEQLSVSNQMKKLLMPYEMGDAIKVLELRTQTP